MQLTVLITFILSAVILLACTVLYVLVRQRTKRIMYQSHITIIGIAQNKDGFAKIMVDDTDSYCMDGMEAWQPDWVNKEIKVIGDLEIREVKLSSKIYADKLMFIKSAVVQLISKELVY